MLGFLLTIGLLLFFGLMSFKLLSTANAMIPKQATTPPLLLAALLVLIVGFHIFAFGIPATDIFPALGWGAFGITLLTGLWLSMFPAQRTRTNTAVFIFGAVVSSLIFLRANTYVWMVDTLTLIALVGAMTILKLSPRVYWTGLWWIKRLVLLPALVVAHVWRLFTKSTVWGLRGSVNAPLKMVGHSWKSLTGQHESAQEVIAEKTGLNGITLGQMLRTLIITGVALLVFVPLLSMADPVFADYLSKINENLFARIIWTLVISVIGVIWYSIQTKEDDKPEKLSMMSSIELLVPAGVLVALFGFFLLVQIRYLFGVGGSDTILQELKLTYSEYARKGFFELLVTTGLASILSYLLARKARDDKQQSTVLTVVNSVLVGELLFMLISAAKRNWMYIDEYGLTRPRLAAGMFMAWLAIYVLLLMGMGLMKHIKEKVFILTIGASLAGLVLLYNVVNIDAVIARFNPKTEWHEPDYFYFSMLSPEIVTTWEDVIDQYDRQLGSIDFKDGGSATKIARAKLALINLETQRNLLYLQYAPVDRAVQVQNDWVGKYPCSTTSYHNYRDYDEKACDTNRSDLSPKNKHKRKFISWNFGTWKAYQHMTKHEDVFFGKLNQSLKHLNEQTSTLPQTDSANVGSEERRIYYDYRYPFTDYAQMRQKSPYYPPTPPSPSPSPTVSPSPTPVLP